VAATVTPAPVDVLVVGGGLAGLSAALAAREAGASVRLLERAPQAERGGNTRFSNGALRAIYGGTEDIRRLVPDLSAETIANTDFGTYPPERYLADFARVTEGRADPMLTRIVVDESFDVLRWLMECGVRYDPLWSAQAPPANGRVTFYGGSAVEARGLGAGLIDALYTALEARGGVVTYGARATALLRDGRGICGASVHTSAGETLAIPARSVVLASGGFESDVAWRTRYLGPGWDLATVRGTRFNTGDGLRMALDAGAQPYGQWSGCHAASWARHAPPFGDVTIAEKFKRDDFMHGIFVNANGRRFVDEGADLRALTYAKYGRVVMQQPGSVAWQVFDAQTVPLLSDDYRDPSVAPIRADTLEELAGRLSGVDGTAFLETVKSYNAAVRTDVPHDPSRKDGRGTAGLDIPKSNWATTIERPPFEAHSVSFGITFTFGGVRIDADTRVLDIEGAAIPGLFAAGEMVGGLFYFNYPGGSGLVSAAVFGRLAGRAAQEGSSMAVRRQSDAKGGR
jgi:tricarballylate dehydrogenase